MSGFLTRYFFLFFAFSYIFFFFIYKIKRCVFAIEIYIELWYNITISPYKPLQAPCDRIDGLSTIYKRSDGIQRIRA